MLGVAPAGNSRARTCRAGIFPVSNARHEVVGLAQSITRSDLQQIFVLDFLQRDAILARFFLNQLASDFNRPLALMNIQPVLDFVARHAKT